MTAFIGNDIVSLDSQSNLESLKNPKYLEKVFSPSELSFINGNSLSVEAAALLWSCKESAYKVLLKLGLDKAFSPGKYEVSITVIDKNISHGIVSYYQEKVYSISENCFDHISTIACNKKSLINEIKIVDKRQSVNDCKTCACILTEVIAPELNCLSSELTIEKVGSIPYLYCKGKQTDVDISFSHDAEYIGSAYLIR